MTKDGICDHPSKEQQQAANPSIKRVYKKPKTKEQRYNEMRERIFRKLDGIIVNCSEDTVIQAYQGYYDNHDHALTEFEKSKWRGRNLTLEEQSLFLNKSMFVPDDFGSDEWKKMKLRYRYRSNGVKLCFSTGNRYDKPQPGTLPNIVTRMGPVALRYGLVAANNFTNAAIADIVTTVWESWITRIDIYVDVAIATDPFVEFVLDNRCAGRLSKKVRPYLKKKLTDDGCLTAVDGNGVHVNLGGDVEVVIYDKADKFDSDESEESKRVYEDKHGEITSKLTRFEFRFHRPFLTSWGYNGGHCINTVDDWLKCRASLVKYVMTKLFRFTEKDGKTLLVWEWIGNQFQNWVESDNDRLGITSVDIERVIKPQTVSVTRLFKQIAGTARTAMLRQTRERVRDEFQLMQWLQQEILKPEMREKVFNAAFHQDSALKYLKFKSQFDNSDILNNSIITSESQELEYGAIHYLLMGTSYDDTNINNTLLYNDI